GEQHRSAHPIIGKIREKLEVDLFCKRGVVHEALLGALAGKERGVADRELVRIPLQPRDTPQKSPGGACVAAGRIGREIGVELPSRAADRLQITLLGIIERAIFIEALCWAALRSVRATMYIAVSLTHGSRADATMAKSRRAAGKSPA